MIVKLGCIEVYSFLIFASKLRLWVEAVLTCAQNLWVEAVLPCTQNLCFEQTNFFQMKMQISHLRMLKGNITI